LRGKKFHADQLDWNEGQRNAQVSCWSERKQVWARFSQLTLKKGRSD